MQKISPADQQLLWELIGGFEGFCALKNGEVQLIKKENTQKVRHVCDVHVHTQAGGYKPSDYFSLKEERGLCCFVSPKFKKLFLRNEIIFPLYDQTLLRCLEILVPYELLHIEKEFGGEPKTLTTLGEIIFFMLLQLCGTQILSQFYGIHQDLFVEGGCTVFHVLDTENQKQKVLLKWHKDVRLFEVTTHLESGCIWHPLKRIVGRV